MYKVGIGYNYAAVDRDYDFSNFTNKNNNIMVHKYSNREK